MDDKNRCGWGSIDADPVMRAYHDHEWGVPVHDDQKHFEFLLLEGAQAGLSWSTILHRRAGYAKAFRRFDPKKVARFDTKHITRLTQDHGIVRNRLKIESAVRNARPFSRSRTNSTASIPMPGGSSGENPARIVGRPSGTFPPPPRSPMRSART